MTFLFTDIEGSTGLMQRLGDGYPALLEEHRRMVRSSLRSHDGFEVDTAGDGFLIVFADAGQAIAACLEAQLLLACYPWPQDNQIRVRMGMHTGVARPSAAGDYTAVAVHQAARICAAGHGGQMLLSAETARMARHFLPAGSSLVDRGLFMLRGFDDPERIFQLVHADLESSFPPLRASPAQSHNLPDMRTSFVGRAADLTGIDDLLARHRLVSVIGPGGTGKTRVCIEAAARLVPKFEWGIRLCDLSPLREPALVSSTIAAALGVRERTGAEPLEAVALSLADRRALLLLDSCEHVIPGASVAVDTLLRILPGLTILAASRQPLGVAGERVWRMGPLLLPPPGPDVALDQVRGSEAVQLFESRARVAHPGFVVSESNMTAVADVCRQLEGVPLAIELAAAQVASLPLQTILDRLKAGPLVPGPDSSRSSDRHRTLEATVDWSYRLLDEEGRRLLRFLSVFANGFSVEAARAVSDAGDPVAVLTDLVNKSLVVWDPDAARYRLLETIRTFARAHLEAAGEADVAASRHLAWCASFSDSLKSGHTSREAFELFDRELDNFRAALSWAAAHQSAEGVRLADAVGPSGLPPVEGLAGVDAAGKDEPAEVWEAVIGPDRAYYDRMGSIGVEFPEVITRRHVKLSGEFFTIGRRSDSRGVAPEIDLSPPPTDFGVSHEHALLVRQPGRGWAIVDPGSTNGVFLNDAARALPANRITALSEGDRIHLGAWTTVTICRLARPGP